MDKRFLLPIVLCIILVPTFAWDLITYEHREGYNISSNSENLTDVETLFEIDTATLISAGKMEADGDDIKFWTDSYVTPFNKDFEDDTAGGNPAGWTLIEGGIDGIIEISTARAHSGSKSVKMTDNNGGAGAYPEAIVTFNPLPSDTATIEGWINVDEFTGGEEIFIMLLDEDGTYQGQFVFNITGGIHLYASGSVKTYTNGTYSFDTWTHFEVQVNDNLRTYKLWVGEAYVGEFTYREYGGTITGSQKTNRLQINGGSPVLAVWYVDDFEVSSPEGEIPYWIEDGTINTTNTKIRVRLPITLANENRKTYMYYGYPSATIGSSAEDTFDYWDDFEDGCADWTEDPAGAWVCSGGDLIHTGTVGEWIISPYITLKDFVYTVYSTHAGSTSASGLGWHFLANNNDDHYLLYADDSGDKFYWNERTADSFGSPVNDDGVGDWPDDTSFIFETEVFVNGSFFGRAFWENGTLYRSTSWADTSFNYGYVGFYGSKPTNISQVLIRKTTSAEITLVPLGEESYNEMVVSITTPDTGTYYTENTTVNLTLYWPETDETNYTLTVFVNDVEHENFTGSITNETLTFETSIINLYDGVFTLKANVTETFSNSTATTSKTLTIDLYDLLISSPSAGETYNNITVQYNATCRWSSGNLTLMYWDNETSYGNISKTCPFSEILSTTRQSTLEGNRTITINMLPKHASESQENDSVWYYSDIYDPNSTWSRNLYEGFRNNITEFYTFQFNDTFTVNMSCAITLNSDSYNANFTNTTSYVYNYTLNDGTNTMTINCTDDGGNYLYDSDSHHTYAKYFILIDETTAGNFSLSDANITVVASNYGESLDMNDDGQIWKYWVSNGTELLRTELTFEGYDDIILRNFDVDVMYTSTRVCATTITNFFEQIMYSSSATPVYVKNQFANCYIVSDNTRYAYSGALMTFAHSRSALYYLYINTNGATIYLASIEGGTASQIDLDMLKYNQPGWSLTLAQDMLAVSKLGNSTLYIFYKNNAGDNEEFNFKIYDGTTKIFDHTETSEPNNFALYFDYSTMTITNDPLKIEITKTLTDGSEVTFTKYISLEGKVGTLPKEVSIFLAVGLLFFSVTLVAKGEAMGWFGALGAIAGIALLSFSVATWEVLLMEVVFTGVLFFATVLSTTQHKKSKIY